ncbi:MAG: tetratricopeptide repeat protein, partial [Chlorobium sp.]|uniref:tetratricopeptide repeat protein n=1 Tax=Chlorobium sp. TaxID=1095 RepID=UPI002F40E9E8
MTSQKIPKNGDSRNADVSMPSDARLPGLKNSIRNALSLHKQGHLDEAEAIYQEILGREPDDFDALRLLAALLAQKKRFPEAVKLFQHAIRINSGHAEAWYNYATSLQELKKPDKAAECYARAIALQPGYAEAYFNRGLLYQGSERYQDALSDFDMVIRLRPDYAEVYYHRGNVLKELKRYAEAITCYEKALACRSDYAAACSMCGNILREQEKYHEALEYYDRALSIDPGYAEVCNNRGVIMKALMRYEEALSCYDRALELKPGYAKAYLNKGSALHTLKRYEEALSCYEKALELKPDYAEVYFAQGVSLQASGRNAEAMKSYDKAEDCNYGFVGLYVNRGVLFTDLKRHSDAVRNYEKALDLKPDCDFLFGQYLHSRMHICDWRDFAHNLSRLERHINISDKVTTPFPVLALVDKPELQLQAVRIFMAANCPERHDLPPISRHASSGRIRIGYYSSDFHNHATAYLMAELFERHDRSRFELTAFSFGPDSRSWMRRRVAASFDRFIDVQNRTDREIAELSRELGIDIAVDLKGFTAGSRTGIFAYRAAPVQVNYLGYPGTMGAPYIDYLIADRVLIPESSRRYYTEKIVCLPDSYQVNDRHRHISERLFTREECGLPEQGFVFACFNNNYKITPDVFDVWMRILKRVEGSVLWLFEKSADAVENLRKEAAGHGVSEERLVFAKHLPLSEHLSRHRLADLFLDTFPYNAHTTASDALWAGLLVLTRMGESFAGRVAASLLHAIGLPELVTATEAEYEALAVGLAMDPERLRSIREKLLENRERAPLFDTERFTGYLEAAYNAMYRRYHDDLPPDHLEITEVAKRSDVATRLPSALALQRAGRLEEAAEMYRDILHIEPDNRRVLNLSIDVALQLKRFAEVVLLADRMTQLDPSDAGGYTRKGGALTELKRYKEAVSCFDQAVRLKHDVAEIYNNRGVALAALGRYDDAVANYQEALRIREDYAVSHANLAGSLVQLKRYADAVSHYEKALRLKPDYDFLFGEYLHLKMKIGDWHDLGVKLDAFKERIERREKVSTPFPVLGLLDAPSTQKKVATVFAAANYPENKELPQTPKRERKDRIRIGYYSGDFHNHATVYLMAELFDRHDRSRFELIAFSFGPDKQDGMRMRVAASFDRFLDVRNRSDREIAELSRELGIDIAVDLKGYTKDSRTGIFAYRAAPVQVNYLGYPGTMGAPYIDYLIADRVLIPASSGQYYTEKIVWMPDSYQVNDAHRKISERAFTRRECGLPEQGFVF